MYWRGDAAQLIEHVFMQTFFGGNSLRWVLPAAELGSLLPEAAGCTACQGSRWAAMPTQLPGRRRIPGGASQRQHVPHPPCRWAPEAPQRSLFRRFMLTT